jgi:hypothetical protein
MASVADHDVVRRHVTAAILFPMCMGCSSPSSIHAIHGSGASPEAMIPGLRIAYLAGGVVELAGALITLAFIRGDSMEQQPS